MNVYFLWVYLLYFFEYESNICSSPGFRHILSKTSKNEPEPQNKTKQKTLKLISSQWFIGHFCKFFDYFDLIHLDLKT